MRVHISGFSHSLVDADYHPMAILTAVFVIVGATLLLLRRVSAARQQFVDTHVHLWHADNLPPWLSDAALASIAVTRSIFDHATAAGEGLSKAVYMEVDVDPKDRDAEAQSVVALCRDPKNVLAGAVIGAPIVDGTVAEFEKYVRRWAAEPAVKGVRQVLHIQPKGTCLLPAVVAKARLCAELGLVFELCMRCDELEDAAELARQIPEGRFVVDHCGGHHQLTAEAAPEKRRAWEAGITSLAKMPNVWCKLSGLLGAQGGNKGSGSGAAASWSADEQLVTMGYCFKAFAPNRLIFGGDWPVSTLTAPLRDNIKCWMRLIETEDNQVRAMVLRENAEEVYRLE